MAQVTITTTAAQDKAVQYRVAALNAANGTSQTAVAWAQAQISHWLDGLVQSVLEETRTTAGDLYNSASDADKAAIDLILAAYR